MFGGYRHGALGQRQSHGQQFEQRRVPDLRRNVSRELFVARSTANREGDLAERSHGGPQRLAIGDRFTEPGQAGGVLGMAPIEQRNHNARIDCGH